MNRRPRQKNRQPHRPSSSPGCSKEILAPGRLKLVFDGNRSPASWPTVSLCMIVKNEEENLAACLESVADFATEIIIVDTGSTDRTVDLARSFGATVKHFDWIDDFAAARNESIKDATGDWIFWMDADDRLSPDNLNRLRHAAASNEADGYFCTVVCDYLGPDQAIDRLPHFRLFRNRCGIRFERPLHEDAGLSAERLGVTLALTNIEITHTGYAIDSAGLQAKARRNQQIIDRILTKEPNNLFWRYHYAINLNILGKHSEAVPHYEAVIAQPPADFHPEIGVYQAYLSLISGYLRQAQVEPAQHTLEQMLKKYSHRQHAWVSAAKVYLSLGEPAQAVAALQQAEKLAPDREGARWPAGILEDLLMQAYLQLGQMAAAAQAYRNRLCHTHNSTALMSPQRLNQAETALDEGRPAEVISLLHPPPACQAEGLHLLAEACAQIEQWAEAAAHLGAALALAATWPDPASWTLLAKYTLHAGLGTRQAERYCRLALARATGEAQAGPLNLLGIIAMADDQPKQAMSYFVRAALAYPHNPDNSARHNLDNVCRILGLSPAEAFRRQGIIAFKARDFSGATLALTSALELEPDQSETYKLLAAALQKSGRLDEAVAAWQVAQQLLPAA
jgi:glycosyltransferase involved in cell wall biosynthesis